MAKKTRKFKTEVQQLLDLVIHSLYSKKEIYLRELISNASDAIDRAKLESLTNPQLLGDDQEFEIRITPDKEAGTITISDNGIGMSLDEVESNIGTIASSGTRKYMQALKEADGASGAELIGQFGVGFYAAFMVADKVTVQTRRAGSDEPAVKWVSKGAGDYTLEDCDKAGRGTDITLHIREGMEEFLEEWHIRRTVKEYSDYIAFPIRMKVTRTEKGEEGEEPKETVEDETLNSMKAIWKKNKSDITDEEYSEFYKHISHDWTDPLKTIHYAAEGTTEFRALLYLPAQIPLDFSMSDGSHGVHLYVKNVFITDQCKEVMPEYLRFIKGVVDSSDLPLNVSREMLQDDAIIRRIRRSITSKVLSTLKEMRDTESEDFFKFYSFFGRILKEGVHLDFENLDKLKELVHFPSTAGEANPVSLRDYVDRMPESQKDIYFLTAESLETAKNSPHLEAFKSRGFEVLFMVDPIDEWVIQSLTEYDGKKLKPIDRGDIDLDSAEEKKEKEKKREETSKEYKDLLEYIQEKLSEDVKEVRLSNRLTDSACCLVADEYGPNANLERIMKAMNQEVPKSKRILELNPTHPILGKMKALLDADKKNQRLADYAELLLEQALLTEGSALRNPLKFTKMVSSLMVDAQ
jgi:molecular chaperone HtpG